MRYSASEKLEIIHTVEGSHLPAKQTLDMLGIPRTTFYRWYDLYLEGGLDGLYDKPSLPGTATVWQTNGMPITSTKRRSIFLVPEAPFVSVSSSCVS